MDWKLFEKELGLNIIDRKPLSGGDISSVYKLTTSDKVYVLKVNEASSLDMFDAERLGMHLLKKAHVLYIPSVYKVGTMGTQSYLLMEYVERGTSNDKTFQEFGKALTKLHKNTQASYGLERDNWIGALPQSNNKHKEWHAFYCHERIKPQLNLAWEKKLLSKNEIPTEQNILETAEKLFCKSAPSLLHGDLWNGNFLIAADGKVALIDPAVYYGHPMMDIGMTQLFGGFSDEFYTAYFENSNITGDLKGQVALAQLYYLLVHLNLFGVGYKSQVKQILNSYF